MYCHITKNLYHSGSGIPTKLAVMELLFCLFGGFEMFESHKTLFLYDEIHICNRVFYVCANVHAFTIKT